MKKMNRPWVLDQNVYVFMRSQWVSLMHTEPLVPLRRNPATVYVRSETTVCVCRGATGRWSLQPWRAASARRLPGTTTVTGRTDGRTDACTFILLLEPSTSSVSTVCIQRKLSILNIKFFKHWACLYACMFTLNPTVRIRSNPTSLSVLLWKCTFSASLQPPDWLTCSYA